MAYVAHKNGYKIGDKVITTCKHDCCAGYFEKGTPVTVIGISERGYDIEDEEGHRIIEIGWKI